MDENRQPNQNSDDRTGRVYDCLVIGGGPAGLSAALYLARMDRPVALFDAGKGRSTWHQVNHNYLGFPGGVPAQQLRELGRRQLEEYESIEFFNHKIEELERQPDGNFLARTQSKEFCGRTIILCTGVIDQYPHFEGWQDYVGKSMFWCLVCDGYGARGKQVVVAGNTDSAILETLQLTRFTRHLTLLTNSHECLYSEVYLKRLEQAGIEVINDKIDRAEGQDGYFRALYLKSGRRLELEQLFCNRAHVPQTGLAEQLGLELDEEGYIITNLQQETNVPGVYAAGDATLIYTHQVGAAVHEGAQAGLSVNYSLYPLEFKEIEKSHSR